VAGRGVLFVDTIATTTLVTMLAGMIKAVAGSRIIVITVFS